jgi:hypothetical protein
VPLQKEIIHHSFPEKNLIHGLAKQFSVFCSLSALACKVAASETKGSLTPLEGFLLKVRDPFAGGTTFSKAGLGDVPLI